MFDNISSYSLTRSEFLEAEHLYNRKSSMFWTNLAFSLLFLIYAILEIKRINNPTFLVWKSFKESIINQPIGYHIQLFFMYTLASIALLSDSFRRYSPLWRWKIAKDYKNNFIKQENKTIKINETGIKTTSANYREIRKWQDFSKFAENKKIFLLFGQGSKIIPKRIFNDEEQLNAFRTLLTNKITQEKLVK